MSVELNNFVGNDFRLCRCSVAHVKCCWWTTNSCRLCDLCRRFHLEKKLYVTLKMFLLRASKIEESVVLVLQVLKPETEIFSFLQLVVYSTLDLTYHITIFCLINIQKPWVDTCCSQHQDSSTLIWVCSNLIFHT